MCNLTVAEAGYVSAFSLSSQLSITLHKRLHSAKVNSTFQIVSGIFLFIVSYTIRRTGRFKWLFYVTVPIYSSLPAQLAYGSGQTRMLAAGVGISGLCFIWMFMIRNHNVLKNGQMKGMVF